VVCTVWTRQISCCARYVCSGEVPRPVIKLCSEERDISCTVLKVSDINIAVQMWELE